MTWNTDYGLRNIELADVVKLFGSARRAMACTSGDERLILLYLSNPDKVDGAPTVREYEANKYHTRLRELVRAETETDLREAARAAWNSLPGRKTLVACAGRLGVNPKTARKRLLAIGEWPVRT